jgi:uncharacterized membrane protein
MGRKQHMARVTAVFDDRARAERAVTELRRLGWKDSDLSFVARSEDEAIAAGRERENVGERAAKGAAVGAGAGLLFGLAALAIPGLGPFITAGGLASALGATGGALASGAIVGGTSGAIAGALTRAGYNKDESEFYGRTIERGGVLVAVETEDVSSANEVGETLVQHGGHFYGRN